MAIGEPPNSARSPITDMNSSPSVKYRFNIVHSLAPPFIPLLLPRFSSVNIYGNQPCLSFSSRGGSFVVFLACIYLSIINVSIDQGVDTGAGMVVLDPLVTVAKVVPGSLYDFFLANRIHEVMFAVRQTGALLLFLWLRVGQESAFIEVNYAPRRS